MIFLPELANLLPESAALLAEANLVTHPAVSRIVLHGSRGLASGFRPDSDIDLSLLIDPQAIRLAEDLDGLLRDVLHTTLDKWKSPVMADLAAVFDQIGCGLPCFEKRYYDPALCSRDGEDCFGLYKLQKGFNGFVRGAGIQVRHMYPCLVIWRRDIRKKIVC